MRNIINSLFALIVICTVAACGDEQAYGPCGETCSDSERCVETDDGKFQCERKEGGDKADSDSTGGFSAGSAWGATEAGPGGAGGRLNCPEIFDCGATCESGDETCFDQCFNAGKSASKPLFLDTVSCVYNDCNGEVCLACETELMACELDQYDALTCRELFSCDGACESDECFDLCVQKASETGINKAVDVVECWNDKCAGQDECSACGSEESACMND